MADIGMDMDQQTPLVEQAVGPFQRILDRGAKSGYTRTLVRGGEADRVPRTTGEGGVNGGSVYGNKVRGLRYVYDKQTGSFVVERKVRAPEFVATGNNRADQMQQALERNAESRVRPQTAVKPAETVPVPEPFVNRPTWMRVGAPEAPPPKKESPKPGQASMFADEEPDETAVGVDQPIPQPRAETTVAARERETVTLNGRFGRMSFTVLALENTPTNVVLIQDSRVSMYVPPVAKSAEDVIELTCGRDSCRVYYTGTMFNVPGTDITSMVLLKADALEPEIAES